MVATLYENIAAYQKMRDYLETEHFRKCVVFYDEGFIGSYEDFQDAGYDALKRFGRGPYLIRQAGVKRVIRLPYVAQR